MKALSQFFTLVKWEWLRESKGFDTVISMVLFAAITLLVLSFAIDPELVSTKQLSFLGIPETASTAGDAARSDDAESAELSAKIVSEIRYRLRAGILWVVCLLAGAVGIERAFRGGQDEKVLQGILVSPISRATFYHAKLASTFLFVLIMEVIAFGLFLLLFNVSLPLERALLALLFLAVGSLGYVAVGTTLSAMMRSVQGGEVLLRILLFPLMIPVFAVSVDATALLFAGEPVSWTPDGPGVNFRHLGLLIGADLLYVFAGQILFEVVMAEYDVN